MLDDPTLTEFRLCPIDPQIVVSSENGETAYALQTIHHGIFLTQKETEEKLSEIGTSTATLGFEINTECDFEPFDLTTFNADKQVNSCYEYGGHTPGGKSYRAACRFNIGEKVLCLKHEGIDVVFPGIVVGSLTEEYLRQLYESDEVLQTGYSSADNAVAEWPDWEWDSIIILPLVRLNNEWTEIGETVTVNRVYVFPYKKYQV